MTRLFSQAALTLCLLAVLAVNIASAKSTEIAEEADEAHKLQPKVQLAILLDTSNSMDGLINQAKKELWRIVNEFATARRDGKAPMLEVALVEYGNDGLKKEGHYIREVLPLTTDLDKVSEELFKLTTNGGSEYCGAVIEHAATNLKWSESNRDYKAVFVCGNEAFTQGPIDYSKACKAAIAKGIIVNTIFCGDEAAGVNTKWKDGATLADGSFTSINQNSVTVAIKAPQDEKLAELNARLNETYVSYTAEGAENKRRQAEMDDVQTDMGGSAQLAQRVNSKAQAYYDNTAWDLLDGVEKKAVKLEDIKDEQLPEEIRGKSLEEKQKWIDAKLAERKEIQEEISTLFKARETYVAAERQKQAETAGQTLDAAMESMIREQATSRGFEFEQEQQVEEPTPDDAN